jgi:lipopolysaccharide export system protein LptA
MLKQLIRSKKSLFFGAILFAIPNVVLALPGDREQPIQIDADSAERSEKTGITSYIGSVELTQGSLNILADRIDIYTVNGEVDHAIATGERAYFTQQQSIDKAPVKAWALTIKYFLNDEIINLLGDARIEQDGSIVNSPEIDYYAEQELVKAKGGNQGGKDRVHVTLPPQNKSDSAGIETKNTTPVALDEKVATTKESITAAIEPLIEVLEPIANDTLEQIKAASANTTETP